MNLKEFLKLEKKLGRPPTETDVREHKPKAINTWTFGNIYLN